MAELRVLNTVSEMRREAQLARALSRRIAFVPTMGFLHAGHVSLLDEARKHGDVLVLSIFVNPAQFGPHEDLARYPSDLAGDLEKARAAGVDLVFVPTVEEMYPSGFQSFVEVRELSRGLCADTRPGHFTGVATVVLKLFHLVQPHVAFFGEKDFQQLQVIKRMVRDLEVPVAVMGMPIVREPDGIAMSSRNAYLSPDERVAARSLSRALQATRACFSAGERDPGRLVDAAASVLAAEPAVRLDYLALRDLETLASVRDSDKGELTRPAVLAVAAFLGKTRLIDNLQLRP